MALTFRRSVSWTPLLAALGACAVARQEPSPAREVAPVRIALAGPLAHERAEISGMAWHGDDLVLLPQYPDFEKRRGVDPSAGPAAFALTRGEIAAAVDGGSAGPLAGRRSAWRRDDVAQRVEAQGMEFEGFEAIAFAGDDVYLTVEAQGSSDPSDMRAFLVPARAAPDLGSITLDASRMVQIRPPVHLVNMSCEALVVSGQRIVALFEANGAGVSPSPVAWEFDRATLAPVGTVAFPSVDHRITDATPLDGAGAFWAFNYGFPGEAELLAAPKVDPIAAAYGQGPTHAQFPQVERLVEFRLKDGRVERADRPPVQLELTGPKGARNWEAIARFDERGFLIATDRFPETILAFVPASSLSE